MQDAALPAANSFVFHNLPFFTHVHHLHCTEDDSAHMQACVVGVSCMQDVMDHMEKRVKSRFSHRRILIKPPTDFEARQEQVRGGAPPSLAQKVAQPTTESSSRPPVPCVTGCPLHRRLVGPHCQG